jgi:hypothetical protein
MNKQTKTEKAGLFNPDVYTRIKLGEAGARDFGINEALKQILMDKRLLGTIKRGKHKIKLAQYNENDPYYDRDIFDSGEYKDLELVLGKKGLLYTARERVHVGYLEKVYHVEVPIFLNPQGIPSIQFKDTLDRGLPDRVLHDYEPGTRPAASYLDFTTGTEILKNLEPKIEELLK